jgi:Cu(I)/Ag(I) efflux system membrane fusion protein
MKFNKLISNSHLRTLILILAGFFAGWLVFHRSSVTSKPETEVTEAKKTIWTCSMHPQIRKEEPGLCPLCAMDLIPLAQDAAQVDPNTITMTEDAAKIAEVQTSVVSQQVSEKEVRLYGKIEADERLLQTQPSHLAGRIEQLLINFTGEEIHKGQTIARIYSPTAMTAEQELFEALKMKDTAIIKAARNKLRQWKFTDSQITEMESSKEIKSVFDVTATTSGIIIAKKVNIGDYVQQGSALYEIADLSRVWALFDAYESDLPWIRVGNKVTFTLQSVPGKEFTGTVSFIDPVINSQTRVARCRVEVRNSGNILKPGMFASGYVKSHTALQESSLAVPHSSVLWTGTRSIVYVKVPESSQPTFQMREITLGPDLGESYVVLDGLEEGEEIVTNGTFNIDASAQLMGIPSMMNDPLANSATSESIKKVAASKELMDQINGLLAAYNELKNAFVGSDAKKATKAANLLSDRLKTVDKKEIGAEQMDQWKAFSSTLDSETQKIASNTDIEQQRVSFSPLSNEFYKILKLYGSEQTVYYQYCPMAFDNKGAFWLSEAKIISNPYFGESMLRCGETKEVIKN